MKSAEITCSPDTIVEGKKEFLLRTQWKLSAPKEDNKNLQNSPKEKKLHSKNNSTVALITQTKTIYAVIVDGIEIVVDLCSYYKSRHGTPGHQVTRVCKLWNH